MRRCLILLVFLFILLYSSPAQASGVGLGIGPPRLSLEAITDKIYSFEIIVFNPGDYDVKAKLDVKCQTCASNITLFGTKIGEIREDYRQFFSFDAEDIYIPNNTNLNAGDIPITVNVNPGSWTRKDIVFFTPEALNYLVRLVNPGYTGEFSIPYYSLLTDDKYIKANIVVSAYWSTFGSMGATPSVGVPLDMHIQGIPFGSVLIVITIILLIIIAVAWKFRRPIYRLVRRQ